MAKDYSAPGELELVRLFVNSLDVEHPDEDPFVGADTARKWLAAHGFSAELEGEQERATIRELREALRGELLAHTGEGDPENAWKDLATQLSGTGLELVFGDGEHVRLEPRSREGFEGLRGAIASRVYNAVKTGEWRRLKACRKHTCLFAFYDKSKNGSGTWCDMAICGNRVKAQRRRTRERTSPVPERA